MGTPDGRVRVLFVCLGNICRSPLAESVFRHLVSERGLESRFEIDSAGTSGYHVGDAPDARTTATARARGIRVEGTSRRVTAEDLQRFDYVIAMDAENFGTVERMRSRVRGSCSLHLLREWDPEGRGGDVPDPYYGGGQGFDEVHEIVERSCDHLLRYLGAERE